MKALARREDILEIRFVHEQVMHFKGEARRNKALARWATGRMGTSDQDAEAYQDTIIALALRTGSDVAIVERVSLDLALAGIAVSQVEVRRQMDALWAEVRSNPA